MSSRTTKEGALSKSGASHIKIGDHDSELETSGSDESDSCSSDSEPEVPLNRDIPPEQSLSSSVLRRIPHIQYHEASDAEDRHKRARSPGSSSESGSDAEASPKRPRMMLIMPVPHPRLAASGGAHSYTYPEYPSPSPERLPNTNDILVSRLTNVSGLPRSNNAVRDWIMNAPSGTTTVAALARPPTHSQAPNPTPVFANPADGVPVRKFTEDYIREFREIEEGGSTVCGIDGCVEPLLPDDAKGVKTHLIEAHFAKVETNNSTSENQIPGANAAKRTKGKNTARQAMGTKRTKQPKRTKGAKQPGEEKKERCRRGDCNELVLAELGSQLHHMEVEHLRWRYCCPDTNCNKIFKGWCSLKGHFDKVCDQDTHMSLEQIWALAEERKAARDAVAASSVAEVSQEAGSSAVTNTSPAVGSQFIAQSHSILDGYDADADGSDSDSDSD